MGEHKRTKNIGGRLGLDGSLKFLCFRNVPEFIIVCSRLKKQNGETELSSQINVGLEEESSALLQCPVVSPSCLFFFPY